MILKKRSLALFLLILNFGFTTQERSSYNGLIKLNNTIYQAHFDYYVSDGDTIYDGPFNISKEIIEEEKGENFKYEAAKGSFTDGTPEGKWQIRMGDFAPTGKAVVNDYNYQYKIDGTEFLAKGNFKNGLKNGLWTIYDWKIDASNIKDTLLRAELPFKENQLNGAFNISRKDVYLEAQVDKQHFTKGKWSFYINQQDGSTTLLKEWIFSDARLVQKIFYDNDEAVSLKIDMLSSPNSEIEEMQLSENYLRIIDMKVSLNDPEVLNQYYNQPRVRDQFFLVIEKLNKLDSVFNNFSTLEYSPGIKTKLRKFTYTNDEQKLLDHATEDIKKVNALISEIKDNVQVNLSRLSIKEVAFYVAVLEEIENSYIDDLRELVENYENGNLEYVERDKFVDRLIKKDRGSLEVEYSLDGEEYQEQYTFDDTYTNTNNATLKDLESYFSYTKALIKQVGENINKYVVEVKQEKRLQQSEEQLIKKYDSIKTLTDSIIGPEHNDLAGFDVNKELKEFADKSLKQYSELEGNNKSEAVASYMNCFSSLENLLMSLKNVPENDLLVEEAFTNTVFNPYTFTNMDEIIKEPIFESYREVLLPQLFEALKGMSCDNLENQVHNFETLFDGMINVSQASTRREERKIRRVKDAEKAAQILNLDLRF